MLLEILLLILVSLLAKFYFSTRPENFPPGLTKQSILGGLTMLVKGRPFQEVLFFLSKIQGPLVGFKLGGKWCVAVNGYEAVKEVLSREDCSFRPVNVILTMRSFDKRLGILFADGNLWKTHRRFAIRHLRDFGFGKSSTERMIRDEAEALADAMRTRSNRPEGVHVHDLLPISVINVLWAMMAGQRHDHEDEEFKELLENITEFTRQGHPIMMIFTWLRFVPLVNTSFKKLMKSAYILQSYIKDVAEQHAATYEEGVVRDFMDVFLGEVKKGEDPTFDMEQLIVVCMDLFLGGTDTTSNALGFALLYLACFPRIQEKLRQEMHSISPGMEPALKDAQKFNYYHAFVQETLRHSSMVPMTPPHTTDNDITLSSGYNLPKGTSLLINLYSLQMDKSHWIDPENFRPERFLDETGKYLKDPFAMPFGHGPRLCLGEPLARDTMFIFLTTILFKFKFSLPTAEPQPSLEPLEGLVQSPRPYKLLIEEI
ncbi:methyl farnesoate epoxidase-like [Neocloeon triangulifer]|uniref:methyl farnesoate epoxidase-like n=1 Tax=Neocloeon triangulifer TaxID=2078957 RepID=UPI00286F05C0|nr:methyl farnesoate epoxidase-like [Neocloeon triangulifer]